MSYTGESLEETLRKSQAAAPRQLRVPQPLPPDLAQLDPPQMARVVFCMPRLDSSSQFAHGPCEPPAPADEPGPAQAGDELPYADLGMGAYVPQRVGCEPPAQVAGDLAYADFDKCVYQFPHAPCVPPHLNIANLGQVLDPLMCTQHPSTRYGMPSGPVWPPECDSSGQAGCGHGSREQQARPATCIMHPECRHFHLHDASFFGAGAANTMIAVGGGLRQGGRDLSRGARTMGNKFKGVAVGLFNARKNVRTWWGGEATSTGKKT